METSTRSRSKLSGAQRKWLRGMAHTLRPVVQIGKNGFSDAILQQIDEALEIHELIKVQAPAAKEEKQALARRLEEELAAEAVGLIGHVLILYRRNPDPEKQIYDLP
jgi:RNA-binding protein